MKNCASTYKNVKKGGGNVMFIQKLKDQTKGFFFFF